MTAPGVVISRIGLRALGGGISCYTTTTSFASLFGQIFSRRGRPASALGALIRKGQRFVFAPLTTLLLSAFFTNRLMLNDDSMPSGLMAVPSLIARYLH